ncbi:hypothetical protein EV361DRAFT_943347 [Lentinula raphanica]|nr:hypothetical protein EV361DRAFT_943347 [Lentinula raphanica]
MSSHCTLSVCLIILTTCTLSPVVLYRLTLSVCSVASHTLRFSLINHNFAGSLRTARRLNPFESGTAIKDGAKTSVPWCSTRCKTSGNEITKFLTF